MLTRALFFYCVILNFFFTMYFYFNKLIISTGNLYFQLKCFVDSVHDIRWVTGAGYNLGELSHQTLQCGPTGGHGRITARPWWRHQLETFSALLALCAGNSPVTGEFPTQRPVARSFDVFFDLHMNERLSKQSIRRWFETPSRSSWRHCNAYLTIVNIFEDTPSYIMVY